ncbi:zinc metalloprotease HtpX [Candidatus Woesearchaeota archaeon]|nr:zinc metalloprotease HtpX [Candidatus Woesearchaeota archaeon]
MNGNHLKTALLLGALTGLMLFAGGALAGQGGLLVALLFALLMNLGSWWFSDRIVLWMHHAKEIKEDENPRLYGIVREVARKAGVPMPKVCVVPSASPNAFATGRDPQHAAVAATAGILTLLDDEELKGVIAHEVAHIRNRDTLIATIAATIAGVISYLALMARWAALFGGFGRDRDNNIIEVLALAILTPLIATVIQLAISRSREFLADETGARMLHTSQGLASGLEKLERGIALRPMQGNQATASLFIANPFRGNALFRLFSTHPPMEERVKRLRSLRLGRAAAA